MHARTRVVDSWIDGDGVAWMDLGALEASGDALAAVVDEEAEVDGHVEVDAQDVGPQRRAQAHRRLQVGEALDERAAGLLRRRPKLEVDEPVQDVRAHTKLQGVDRAASSTSTAAAS